MTKAVASIVEVKILIQELKEISEQSDVNDFQRHDINSIISNLKIYLVNPQEKFLYQAREAIGMSIIRSFT